MAKRKGVLALTKDGQLTICYSVPELVGMGRCNHVDHLNAEIGESEEDFIKRVNKKIAVESDISFKDEEYEPISQDEIDSYAQKIDSIAGQKVTMDNFKEVLSNLPPEKLYEIVKIGFETAPEFSLPVTDERYFEQSLNNKLYFADLPHYGISGKRTSIEQMFINVGEVPNDKGSVFIEGNYKKGLTPEEYFEKQFSSRAASIAKSVSVAEPGYTSRKLFYALSDIQVQKDCKNKKSKGVLDCSIAGGICVKCAKKDGIKLKEGHFIGSSLSTNLGEPLTQLSMREFHTGGKDLKSAKDRNIINNTYDAFITSPIIAKAKEAKTTEERRKIIYEGLKEQYAKNNIKMDDFNVMMIAKKMTSYKNDPVEGKRFVRDGECCSISSTGSIGNFGNPFKKAELQSSYKTLTTPGVHHISSDAANEVIF